MGEGALDGQYRQLHPNPQLEEGAAVGRVPRGANTPTGHTSTYVGELSKISVDNKEPAKRLLYNCYM